MAKFTKAIDENDMVPPVERVAPKAMMAELAKITPPSVSVVQPPVTLPPVAPVAAPEVSFTIQEPSEKKEDEHWMKAYWRPAMGWLYMIMCFCDFVAFPIISIFIPIITKMPYVAWQSLTLSNGGLIHLSFGAILGVAAYGRTQEKVQSKQ
jgi:hypothetical protein